MILSSRFYSVLDLYRVLSLGGVYGTGKTLAAACVAWHYCSRGYRVWSNIPLRFADPVVPDLPYHTVVLLDEGRRYADNRSWQKNELGLIDYARHLDAIFLFAAAFPVDVRLERLTLRRVLRGLPGPIWLYVCAEYESEKGFFVPLLAPARYFGWFGRREDGKGLVGSEGDYLFALLNRVQQVLAPAFKSSDVVIDEAEIRRRAVALGFLS